MSVPWGWAIIVRVMRRLDVHLLLQWLRFAIVGVSNTLLSWTAYAVLEGVGVHYLLASAIAFALGALNSYVLNRRWTFRSRNRRVPELLRFGVVQCVGLGVDVSLLYALTRQAGIHHLIAQALVFPAASAVTFLLSRQWAFAGSRPGTVRRRPSRFRRQLGRETAVAVDRDR
jgi:putative flippase GtrA